MHFRRPICYVHTIPWRHISDMWLSTLKIGAAQLCSKITVLMCEQKPYPGGFRAGAKVSDAKSPAFGGRLTLFCLVSRSPALVRKSPAFYGLRGCLHEKIRTGASFIPGWLFIGLPFGQSPIKKWRPPRLCRKKTKWRTDQVSRSPSPALLLILWEILGGKRWVISGKNCGKETKIVFLSEVISPIL